MKSKKAKPKGRRAWLVTWEGNEFERINRPKIVAVFQPQLGKDKFKFILETLYNSEYPLTLCEKIGMGLAKEPDKLRYFRENYQDVNPEMHYGDGHCFLRARMVKNLVCEESSKNVFECTASWTELAKFHHDGIDPNKPAKQVLDERYESYTYNSRFK